MRESDAELRDIHHHDHRNGQREAFWSLVLICGGGFFLLFQSGLEGFFFYLVGVLVSALGAVVVIMVMHWIGGVDRRERQSLAAEQREAARLERAKQLAEFRARNAVPKDPRPSRDWEVIE